jgi:hypothetical protein
MGGGTDLANGSGQQPWTSLAKEFETSARSTWPAGATLLVALLAFGVTRVKPAAPSVEKSGVWIDTVRRGRCSAR